jgi:hypothetical protein
VSWQSPKCIFKGRSCIVCMTRGWEQRWGREGKQGQVYHAGAASATVVCLCGAVVIAAVMSAATTAAAVAAPSQWLAKHPAPSFTRGTLAR